MGAHFSIQTQAEAVQSSSRNRPPWPPSEGPHCKLRLKRVSASPRGQLS